MKIGKIVIGDLSGSELSKQLSRRQEQELYSTELSQIRGGSATRSASQLLASYGLQVYYVGGRMTVRSSGYYDRLLALF
jgi:hypothetical protein